MVAAAITKGDITVKNVIPRHMEAISAKLKEIGASVIERDEEIRVIGCETMKPVKIKTLPYPGFPTDMQPQIAVALALASRRCCPRCRGRVSSMKVFGTIASAM